MPRIRTERMAATWFIDGIDGHPLPVLIVRGWCTDPAQVDVKLEYENGNLEVPSLLCRESRGDVVAAHNLSFPWPGFIAEFHLAGTPRAIRIYGKAVAVEGPERYSAAEPHYGELYHTARVLHREDIYGSGPPLEANPVVVQLT